MRMVAVFGAILLILARHGALGVYHSISAKIVIVQYVIRYNSYEVFSYTLRTRVMFRNHQEVLKQWRATLGAP